MNVIISNKYKQELDSLDIDISKKQEGEFEVDELIDAYSNYFFNKMIIDITAIKNYQSMNTMQKLSMNLNVEKIIFLLDRDNVNPSFLAQLVGVGIYNFTTTRDGIMYLYNNPNSYSDVAQYQDSKFISNKNIIDTDDKNDNYRDNYDKESTMNYNDKVDYVKPIAPVIKNNYGVGRQHIIGIKNMTSGAGATTLTYMLKNELSNYRDVVAIEINKKDFIFLRDSELVSADDKNIKNVLDRYKNKDVIFIDINNYSDTTMCTDMLYLIEPSTIKLNKMIMVDRRVFDKLSGKKIILNKSLLDKKDITSFEVESRSSVYYSIPPLDEKQQNANHLLPLLQKMNLLDSYDVETSSSNDKFLGLFDI